MYVCMYQSKHAAVTGSYSSIMLLIQLYKEGISKDHHMWNNWQSLFIARKRCLNYSQFQETLYFSIWY